jgi:hypothetical protein
LPVAGFCGELDDSLLMGVEKGGLYLHESIGPLLIRSIQCAFDFIRCLHFKKLNLQAQRLGRDFGFLNA